MTTTLLICSLSVFLLIFAIRIWHMSGLIDELEIRILKLERELLRPDGPTAEQSKRMRSWGGEQGEP